MFLGVSERTFATEVTIALLPGAASVGFARAYASLMLEEEPVPTRPVDRFTRTTAGLILQASLLGLRDALEGPRDDEPAIVVEWSGAPPGPTAVSMRLDPDNPADSIVLLRPSYLPRHES
jgi:hypothetical protein